MMKKFFICLFLLWVLISYSVCAQQSHKKINDIYVIPLHFESWYPSIIITVQGKKIPLQLDLGSAKTNLTINPSLLKKFNIKANYTGNSKQVSDSQGRRAIIKEFILSNIKIENLTLNNISGYETHPFPWGTPGKAPEVAKNGVIGLGLISKYNVIVDYKNKKLILIQGNFILSEYDIHSWLHIPFIFNGNIITRLANENNKINLLWDTGAPINLIQSKVKLFGEIKPCSKDAIYQLEMSQNKCTGIITNIAINNQSIKNIVFYPYPLKGLPADGIIGEPLFKNHIVYINFSTRLLSISNET